MVVVVVGGGVSSVHFSLLTEADRKPRERADITLLSYKKGDISEIGLSAYIVIFL